MTPPNGYIPVESAAIHAAGLADQPMLYWREDWEAPRVMRLSDSECAQYAMGAYVRECKALKSNQSGWHRAGGSVGPSHFGAQGMDEFQRRRLQELFGYIPDMQRSTGWIGPLGLGPIR